MSILGFLEEMDTDRTGNTQVAIYARVSPGQEAKKDLFIGVKLRALRGFAEEKSWQVVAESVDEVMSEAYHYCTRSLYCMQGKGHLLSRSWGRY